VPRIATAQEAPTFTKDVAPILFKNCVVCHKPGESTPMSLLSYETARPWARSIKRRVVAREMPPWFADPAYGHFSNDRRLSQQEIDTIAAWVDGGAQKGRAEDMPAAPTFAKGWRHPLGLEPDAVIEMPVEFTAPAAGEIPMTTFYTPVPFAEDKFVEATQSRPANYAFVHHAVIRGHKLPPEARVDPATGLLVDSKTGKQFEELVREEGVNETPQERERRERELRQQFTRQPQNVFDNTSNVWIGTYAPGWDFERYKPGIGKRVPAGWHIGFNMHYQATGKPEKDRTVLGLWYQRVPTKAELVTRRIGDMHIVEGKQLLDTPGYESTSSTGNRQVIPNIPPYAENWSIMTITPILEPIAVYSWNPHMHLRGRDMKYVVVYPDGQEETLFSVPKFDFNWQLTYENSEPVRIPAGSKIMTIGHMDNSVKNKFNPAPDKEVFWSEQSWDEMFNGFFQFTKDTDPQPRKAPAKSNAKPVSTVSQR
jgi:hypothetical protein